MKQSGYFGIGCYGMKTTENYGSLFRTAQVLNADFLFLIGSRFKIQPTDTMGSWRNMPVFQYASFDQFNEHRPYDCRLIGIELSKKSEPIETFKHPEQAIYLLGSEDNGLPNAILDKCQHIIQLPGERSLNVSVAGSIVIYDRISKIKTK